jgi:hypothetical protein
LRPSQRDARTRIAAAFAEFGGALLADPPGTGKTVVALAVAAEVPGATDVRGAPDAPSALPALVVAPATLRDQWHRAAAHAHVPIRWCSLEALSRGATPAPARLVIVDEAHHARNPATRRYGALAASCVGARVLLLSATPVVNGGADRDALLALFLGARAARLSGGRGRALHHPSAGGRRRAASRSAARPAAAPRWSSPPSPCAAGVPAAGPTADGSTGGGAGPDLARDGLELVSRGARRRPAATCAARPRSGRRTRDRALADARGPQAVGGA